MNTENKRIAKNTGLLYVRQLLTLGLSLYTSRLTLQVLGETDFGIYATVAGFTALISTLTTSLASGTQRFITFELGRGDMEKLNRVYCTAINIHVLLSILLVLIGETIGVWFIFNKMSVPPERLMIAFWVFQLTLMNTVLALINTPNNAEIVAHEDMGTWAFVSIVDAVLRCVCVISLFYISWDKLLMYAFFLFAIQFLIRTLCIWWCKRKYIEVKYHFVWDKPLLKSMLSITGWTGLNNLAVTGFIQGVNLLLNVFFGPVLNAAYIVAMQAYSGIRQFCASFQLASNPQIVKLYSVGELDKMHNLVISVCKLSFYLIFLLSLPFIIESNFVLSLWLKDVPEHTQSFFILLLIFAYFDVFAYPLDISAQATGKLKKYSLSVSIVFISILLFAYIAYSLGGVPETIYYIAILITNICVFIRLFSLRLLIGLSVKRFATAVLLRCLLVGSISTILPFVIYSMLPQSLWSVLTVFVASFLSSIVTIYLLGLDKNEREVSKNILKKILARL